MKSSEWKTYRTRFLIKAKQLTSTLSFTDHLGRQHCGRKGDYLVESFEGVLSIVPRHIFEDIYVRMSLDPNSEQRSDSDRTEDSRIQKDMEQFRVEELRVERIKDSRFRLPVTNSSRDASGVPARVRRKSPQPVRPTTPRVGLM